MRALKQKEIMNYECGYLNQTESINAETVNPKKDKMDL